MRAARGLATGCAAQKLYKELGFLLIDTHLITPPIISDGTIDSFVRLPQSTTLFYLGGPACTINGACDMCSNTQLKISQRCVAITSDLSVGDELVIVYGGNARADLLCECGCMLVNHVSVLSRHSLACDEEDMKHVCALERELAFVTLLVEVIAHKQNTEQRGP